MDAHIRLRLVIDGDAYAADVVAALERARSATPTVRVDLTHAQARIAAQALDALETLIDGGIDGLRRSPWASFWSDRDDGDTVPDALTEEDTYRAALDHARTELGRVAGQYSEPATIREEIARPNVPEDYEVAVLTEADTWAKRLTTCGECGRSWDDGVSTSMTPVPSGRCPFEYWH